MGNNECDWPLNKTYNKPFLLRLRRPAVRSIFFLLSIFISILIIACSLPNNNASTEDRLTATPVMATTAMASPGESGARLGKILSSGEIVVVMSPDFAPMEFIDNRKQGQDKYVGTDPWFAKYIADELGVGLIIEAMPFSELHGAVNSGKADLIMSGLAYNENRAAEIELSDFYNDVADREQVLLVSKDRSGEFQNARDFSNKIVAVQAGTKQYELLTEQLPEARPELIDSLGEGVMMLLRNEVDALGIDLSQSAEFSLEYPDFVVSAFRYEYAERVNVIGMMKGEEALRIRINEIINKAEAEERFLYWTVEAEALAREIGWQNPAKTGSQN